MVKMFDERRENKDKICQCICFFVGWGGGIGRTMGDACHDCVSSTPTPALFY